MTEAPTPFIRAVDRAGGQEVAVVVNRFGDSAMTLRIDGVIMPGVTPAAARALARAIAAVLVERDGPGEGAAT
jgi:hypothetical protein